MRSWITITTALSAAILVSCAHREQSGGVTIRAVRATGSSFGPQVRQPIWRFAVTNTGKSDVVWMSGIEVQGGSDKDYSNAGGHIDWPEGVFAPGQGIETDMIVPAKTGSVWRAYVEFWKVAPEDLKKAQADAARFHERVSIFCPIPKTKGLYNDEWHH